MARRRLGAAEWAELIDQWQQSGPSLPDFCHRRGLNDGTMKGWLYKHALKRAVEDAPATTGWGGRVVGPLAYDVFQIEE